jgi:glycosyltransferase involved in cell wall biosynthesis
MGEEFEPGLVSVILPTYNHSGVLLQAMDSVYAQTYRPIELIVVDDGSTDGTNHVVEAWTRHHTRDGIQLRYLHQKNAGAPAARNLGMIESRGEYIQFLDSDDMLHPERIDRVVQAFGESQCDFLYSGIEMKCLQCGQVIFHWVPTSSEDPFIQCLHGKLWISSMAFAWRRGLATEVGPWDESLVVFQDYDYGIRTLLLSRKGVALSGIYITAREGGGSQIGDKRYTRIGYECQLRCESRLCDAILTRDVPISAKRALAARLYNMGSQLYRKYHFDQGRKFGALAERIVGSLDNTSGIHMRNIWRMGRIACIVYFPLRNLKYRLLGLKPSTSGHVCSAAGQQ